MHRKKRRKKLVELNKLGSRDCGFINIQILEWISSWWGGWPSWVEPERPSCRYGPGILDRVRGTLYHGVRYGQHPPANRNAERPYRPRRSRPSNFTQEQTGSLDFFFSNIRKSMKFSYLANCMAISPGLPKRCFTLTFNSQSMTCWQWGWSESSLSM